TNSPASDVAFIVDVTNTSFTNWQLYSNTSVILFTNYFAKPFACTPKCVISPANGNFDFDVQAASSTLEGSTFFSTTPLQYMGSIAQSVGQNGAFQQQA